MVERKKPGPKPSPDHKIMLQVSVTPATLEEIHGRLQRRQQMDPLTRRSDVVRDLILVGLKHRDEVAS